MRISWKIFGISLLVFLVMAVSAAFSIYKIFKINGELQVISKVFAPLSDEIAQVEIAALQQELHLERVEKLEAERRISDWQQVPEQQLGSVDASPQHPQQPGQMDHLNERIQLEIGAMEQRSAEVEALLARSKQRVATAQGATNSFEDRLELAALTPSLVALERQHANFHSHSLNLIRTSGLPENTRESLEEQLEAEEAQLAEAVDELRRQISEFTIKSIADAARHEQEALYASMTATVSAGILALLLSSAVIKGLLRPMRQLTEGTRRVSEGDLSVQVPRLTRDEVGDLTDRFNAMVEGLQSTQKIKDTFGQYLDPRVVSGLIGERPEAVAGEKKIISAYFSDLADFTTISEQFTPSGLVRVLNRYLDLMSVPITGRQGVIDKYIGDAIMAYWAPPFCEDGQQAGLAVETALENQLRMTSFQHELPDLTGLQKNLPRLRQRIGIATGEAVVGSIGSEQTKNYTVMGDTVNLGSRLEGANKLYGTSILVCERTRDMTHGIAFRLVDRIQVVGKTDASRVFTPLIGDDPKTPEICGLSEEAVDAYASRNWIKARSVFQKIADLDPTDTIAPIFSNRLDLIERNGVPDSWDGIWHMRSK
ncbi:adenylate cyclase [Roseibium hamelinense]|uniref:Adenylate cyclase n=2 Tax=Roseibium hamelinense TaxID=150831 RepID=A0A562SJ17_9HYPH|nr:adenylate cyclase [Roseibium hamelinense]